MLTLRRHARLPAVAALLSSAWLAGCKTSQTPTMVAPPGTGMIGQPAPYGGWASPPQGAAYPAGPIQTPMPGPATQWQAAPLQNAAPPQNTWSWSQPTAQPPSLQQYGTQLQNTAQQYQQDLTNQTQQYVNQLQAQPQQYANQFQQQVNAQQQQLTNQTQATMNQYQQGLNDQWRQMNDQLQNQTQQAFNSVQQQGQQVLDQGQQALGGAQQQITAQMPQWPQQTPQYQPTYQSSPYQTPSAPTTTWNPFATSATSLPPARATPLQTVPRY